jgi:histidine phosphotransfer protein HptB
MEQPCTTSKTLVSDLAGDSDLAELIALFVEELPKRAEAMQQAMEAADLDRLSMLAHQLKGAAGSYGFSTITGVARTVEQAAKSRCPLEQLTVEVNELAAMCRSARATA